MIINLLRKVLLSESAIPQKTQRRHRIHKVSKTPCDFVQNSEHSVVKKEPLKIKHEDN